jgi:hypothetical protein
MIAAEQLSPGRPKTVAHPLGGLPRSGGGTYKQLSPGRPKTVAHPLGELPRSGGGTCKGTAEMADSVLPSRSL